jgi:hypothetical protein
MRIPDAAELLATWEEGAALRPVERGLLLLGLTRPGPAPAALDGLSVGERDAQLLRLREALFGPRLYCAAACPACGERLEFDFEVADVLPRGPAPASSAGEMSVESGGYLVRFRLPTSADLLAVAEAGDASDARQRLLSLCVTVAERAAAGGAEGGAARPQVGAAQLPPHVVEAVVERMGEADPLADTQLALNCPACGRAWNQLFDIGSYLWAEIGDWARRTLREVHALARAYGWREADILALSAQRRQWYLEMIGA